MILMCICIFLIISRNMQSALTNYAYFFQLMQSPQLASENAIKKEILDFESVADSTCPFFLYLDRIVLTSSGTLLACWQVAEGSTEPEAFRHTLAQRFPETSRTQVIRQNYILHSTIARIVTIPSEWGSQESNEIITKLEGIVSTMSSELCGSKAIVDRAWYVQEQHLLALALDGSFKKNVVAFSCQ